MLGSNRIVRRANICIKATVNILLSLISNNKDNTNNNKDDNNNNDDGDDNNH